LSSKKSSDMLLDEIIFGQDTPESKEEKVQNFTIYLMNNIDEIEELLGIKEPAIDPVKKKKLDTPPVVLPKIEPTPTPTPTPTAEENMTSMGNVDEVKEAMGVSNTQPIKVEKSINRKEGLAIRNEEMDSDSVYAIPQVNPVFPGGQNAMSNFFSKNITLPENSGKAIKGKVFVRFMVKKNGELSNIYLVKGLSDACNQEALRVVKKMPSWIPATQDKKNVNAWYILPIYFEIE
jgi:periplasmic protein TonB